MTDTKDDSFDLKSLVLPTVRERLAVVPRKIQKRRQHFVKVPWTWIERLSKTGSPNTYRVALHLLYLHWKQGGHAITLANGMLIMEGVSRWAKWRALRELEQLGLINIECRPRKSPLVTVIV
jgi:hypothetical protein